MDAISYNLIVEEHRSLAIALTDLHNACEFWEDQQDPVLVNARKALRNAGYNVLEPD